MKLPKNFCRVVPPVVARNPFLIWELAGTRRRKIVEDFAMEHKLVLRKISQALQDELLKKIS